jgi:hypothetical protein
MRLGGAVSDEGWRSEAGSFVAARRDGISEAEVDGELVLLDTSNGSLHVLNGVAAAVWLELDGGRDMDAIVARLSDATSEELERVRADVLEFVTELWQRGLLACPPPWTAAGWAVAGS